MRSLKSVLALYAVLAAAGASAQLAAVPRPAIAFQPRQYIAYRTSTPPQIDGQLNEADWQQAEWTEDFVDIEGSRKPVPRFRTRAKLLWDDDYLYFAVEMEEPDLWATLTERDSVIYHDNDIELFIDPEGSTHRYMELEINQHGTAWDLLLTKPYRDGERVAYTGWDMHGLKIGRQLRGTLNQPADKDQGWTVEVAIPWRALRESHAAVLRPLAGEQWRLNFSRVEWQTSSADGQYRKLTDAVTGQPLAEDNWVWSPQGVINMHYPEMWGIVQFSAHSVGGQRDSWRSDPAQAARWALREVYYAQRSYYTKHQRFARSLQQLGLSLAPVAGYAWPPQIDATPRQFSARLLGRDGQATLQIDHDGWLH